MVSGAIEAVAHAAQPRGMPLVFEARQPCPQTHFEAQRLEEQRQKQSPAEGAVPASVAKKQQGPTIGGTVQDLRLLNPPRKCS